MSLSKRDDAGHEIVFRMEDEHGEWACRNCGTTGDVPYHIRASGRCSEDTS